MRAFYADRYARLYISIDNPLPFDILQKQGRCPIRWRSSGLRIRADGLTAVSALLLASLAIASCGGREEAGGRSGRTLTVFHAGSLSVPLRKISDMFMEDNPGVTIQLEAAGSRSCARKISDLGRRCDVMASADYSVIDNLLIPGHASWNIKFASNEMAIVYSERSRRHDEIDPDNWFEILLDPDIAFGRSDPDADPCGYRAVLAMRLAGKHYGVEDLAGRLLDKDTRYIRPKETDLLALLETGTIDYIFLYRSVAQQHGLPYLVLPDEINLKSPDHASLYGTVSVEVSGKRPGEKIVKKGAPMVYGITIPANSPDPDLAIRFVDFILDPGQGMKVMEEAGQPSMVPSPSETYGAIPAVLKKYAKPPE
jgi:molybdate/tungstate transport system substrate-binding protein